MIRSTIQHDKNIYIVLMLDRLYPRSSPVQTLPTLSKDSLQNYLSDYVNRIPMFYSRCTKRRFLRVEVLCQEIRHIAHHWQDLGQGS